MTPSHCPDISVCILSHHRHHALDTFLTALAQQAHAPAFELLVALDNDPAAEATVRRTFRHAAIAHCQGLSPGAMRNRLVAHSTAPLVIFLDDDTHPDPLWLHRLSRLAATHPDVGIFGGPNLTPADAPQFQHAQGQVLASLIGAGPFRHRYRSPAVPGPGSLRNLTGCNLVLRRHSLGTLPEDLANGEETALLRDARRRGHLMLHTPELAVAHQRRPTWVSYARQIHGYGIGRGQRLRRDHPHAPKGATIALTTLVAAAWCFPWPPLRLAAYASTGYLAALAATAATRRRSTRAITATLTTTTHVAYLAGFARGLLRGSRHRPGSITWSLPPGGRASSVPQPGRTPDHARTSTSGKVKTADPSPAGALSPSGGRRSET